MTQQNKKSCLFSASQTDVRDYDKNELPNPEKTNKQNKTKQKKKKAYAAIARSGTQGQEIGLYLS